MSRRPLRLAALLLLTLETAAALASGCATATADITAGVCPRVSCHTEVGYNQCVSAGCSCDRPNDFCIPKGQKPPPPICPVVSCQSTAGYDECHDAGCGCDPRTNGCVPVPKR